MVAKFLIRLFLFSLVIYVGLSGICLFYADPAMRQCELKQEIANRSRMASVPGRRLILVGGSNTMYGFDSPRMERELGIPVVNLGLHAGLGLIFQLDAAKRNLHKGDVVVLMPEYSNFDSDGSCYGKMVMISAITDILSPGDVNLSLMSWAYNWFSIPQLGARKVMHLLCLRKGAVVAPDSWWNEQGDTIRHWSCLVPTYRPVAGSPSGAEPNDAVVRHMLAYREFAASKGASVFLFPPAFSETLFKGDAEYYAKIVDLMRRKGFPFAVPLERYVFCDALIYDSPYHLNRVGLEERTDRFIGDIRPLIGEGGSSKEGVLCP